MNTLGKMRAVNVAQGIFMNAGKDTGVRSSGGSVRNGKQYDQPRTSDPDQTAEAHRAAEVIHHLVQQGQAGEESRNIVRIESCAGC
jgi:hypothetical protein